MALYAQVKNTCQIHFKCYAGYVMKGSPTITCDDGVWYVGEEGAPSCKIKIGNKSYFKPPGMFYYQKL